MSTYLEEEFIEILLDVEDTVDDVVNGAFDIKEEPLRKRSFCIRRVDRYKRLADIESLFLGEPKRVGWRWRL